MKYCPEIIYEDNHLLAINKKSGELVQGDKTGDSSLNELLKEFIKTRDSKPGNVFLGVCHRLDRPVSGVILFAKTGKALARLNDIFRNQEIKKIYWAIVKNKPPENSGILVHYLVKDHLKNKSVAYKAPGKDARESSLNYRVIGSSENYHLLEIELNTGRHHQIRAQLAKIGCPVKGDLKYGFPRSNKDGGISLHARELNFIHPVKKEKIRIIADPPEKDIFGLFNLQMQEKDGLE